jgi:hypothetical protein
VAAAAFSGRTVQQIVVGSLLVVVATAEEGTTSILQRAIQLRAQPASSIQDTWRRLVAEVMLLFWVLNRTVRPMDDGFFILFP